MKRWFQSKMMMVNMLATTVGVLGVLQGSDWIMANPTASATVMASMGATNMVLRLVTFKGIQ